MQNRIALSFSGGKDSCLALYQLSKQNEHIACLFTTVWNKNQKTVAHDQTLKQIRSQAASLNIPIHFIYTDFKSYADDFLANLQLYKEKYQITGVAFGDIYLDGHREWGEEITEKAGLDAFYPLWRNRNDALEMLKEFVDSGFKAKIIKVDPKKLPSEWILRRVDASFIADVSELDVCPMGESGEYHTMVYDGPIFQYAVDVH